MGTPSPTITPDQWQDIITYISKGYSSNMACECACVSKETFYKRMREDSDFSDQVKKARSTGHGKALEKIMDAPQWQAGAWLLERQRPMEFGKEAEVESDYEGEEFVEDDTQVERKLNFITKEEAEQDNDDD